MVLSSTFVRSRQAVAELIEVVQSGSHLSDDGIARFEDACGRT